MFSKIRDPNIWRIYTACSLLGIAYGLGVAVISVFFDERHFTKEQIGSFAAFFALGIVCFSIPVGALVRRFSARTTLTASLLGYAISVAVLPFLPSFPAVALARFLDGVFSVGVWVSCETVLLARADRDNKALVTSFYAITLAFGYLAGPLLAFLIVRYASLATPFFVASFFAVCAAIFVRLRLDADAAHGHDEHSGSYRDPARAPEENTEPSPSTGALLWRIKTSCFGTFAYGYFQAALVLFMPLYLMEVKGVPRDRTIILPAFFAAGMLTFSNYAARMGDRIGHLRMMRYMGTVGAIMIFTFLYLDAFAAMAIAVFVAGASLAAINPVSLALQGHIVAKRDFARANGVYNAFYAAGMLLGPPVSGKLYLSVGARAMIVHLALLWAAFALFALGFRRDDPATKAEFNALPA